jgi:hypothetical protein
MNSRYVLTIATGKKLYLDMAVNLARSFIWWHPDSDIKFQLVTDQNDEIPEDIKPKIQVIKFEQGVLGLGFSSKLNLDKLASEGQTLFVDSDCLIFGDLSRIFEVFKGHKVSVVGGYIADGEWFGDIKKICTQFDVPRLPKFNGGIYYLEKGIKATSVYATARDLEKRYDEIGFLRLRNRPNDEVLMALAMELNQQVPIADDGTIMAEFVNFQSGIKSDLLKGTAELYNNPSDPLYQKNWHLTTARPLVVHFLGHHNQIMPYIKEVKQLKYLFEDNLSENRARTRTYFQVTLPALATSYFKNTFRSLYHSVFGTRKIKKSERIID